MNLSVSTAALANALRTLEKITPAKAVLPILSHVLVRADGQQALLSCTDTELSLTRSCNAVVNQAGQVALPAKTLLDIISQITEPDVHLFAEKNGVRIAAGHFKMRLQSLPAEQFPTLAAVAPKGALVNGATLRNLLRKVRPSITATDKRYLINGALLVFSEKVLALVATDGKRLAVATSAYAGDAAASQFILPTKLVETLLQDDADDYAFSASDNHLFFSTEQSSLTSRTLEGQFPSYQRIIPTANPHTLTVPRDLLAAALKRVSLVAGGETRAVSFNVSANMLQLQARSVELGDAVENVAMTYDGEDTTVNLQAAAVLDFLESAQNPSVTMSMGNASSAVLLADGSDFITVAMAVRA